MNEQAAKPVEYILPPALITRADLARLVREVETVDNDLEAQKARNHTTGKTGYHLPSTGRALADFLELNKIDLANDQRRMELKEHLRVLKDHAPIVHMTFAVDAQPEFLQRLSAYLRKEIHPQALISVGLQPGLIGGVYVRTPNHVHDFSIKTLLASKRDIIMQELERVMHAR
ncbi:MAG TPA: hypothetical protein VLE99_01295 [Candidatus Saccharimonadales bacterium]|nr:hypothetical protein [Candidatus Saccharimonadales bacterium]